MGFDDPGTRVEILLAALLLAVAPVLSRLPRPRFPTLPDRTWLAIPALIALVLQGGISLLAPARTPWVHDEFSHLLLADTLLHGRLSNPPHPMAEFLDMAHVNQTPRYASMYPPVQGAILAASKVLTGHPLAGPSLVAAALGSVLAWAMLPWLPLGWAVFGGTLAAIRIGAFSYWANSYWGGAHIALGGALMLGALPRLAARPSPGLAALFAASGAVTSICRPFEGTVYSVILGVALLWLVRNHPVRQLLAPAAALAGCLGVFIALQLVYNQAVTGGYSRLGYQDNMERHGLAVMAWQKAGESTVSAPNLKRFYDRSRQLQDLWTDGPVAVFARQIKRIQVFWLFFVGPLLTIPLLLRAKAAWIAIPLPASILALFWIGTSPNMWAQPHYYSPATALFVIFLTICLQRFADTAPKSAYVAALPAACLIVGTLSTVWAQAPGHVERDMTASWHRTTPGNLARSSVEAILWKRNGRHLLLVRYATAHPETEEWVANGADIDASRLVWAHDLGSEKNRQLLQYYRDRQVWLVQPDAPEARITPYNP